MKGIYPFLIMIMHTNGHTVHTALE